MKAKPPMRVVQTWPLPAKWLQRLLPASLAQEERTIILHIREGRFQRSLAVITACASLLSGLEVAYEHYIGSYSQKIMYTPVILCCGHILSSIGAIFNRWIARVLLPIMSLLLALDGVVGFFLHIRGVQRKPGGWRLPIFNIVMGPPLFAPLLIATSGFLGLITSFLRSENALPPELFEHVKGVRRRFPLWMDLMPKAPVRELLSTEQDIREGRFQGLMGGATALSAFFSGAEALYSHYKNNFTYKIEWTPILLSPLVMIAGIGTIWSRTIARTLLPITSLLAAINGMLGLYYHLRGISRRPGGFKKFLYNLLYGPPIFAPLLFASTGFLGLLASLLRRTRP
uniref:Uncharacterized protein n=1 Tax=Thermosporothrix sp. COM3 TaxID=2490863 RepID=A0A455SDP0_9CHLR|nr:hypothetical protein KTC_03610 [Thermosporothrix sp. COM3]